MRRLGFIFGSILYTITGFAQDTGAIPAQTPVAPAEKKVFTKVFSVADRSALDIYFMASSYAINKNYAFTKDPVNNSITIDIAIPYSSGRNECIEALDLNGKLTIQTKDGKTRVLLDNIAYKHYDKETREPQPVAKTTVFQSRRPDCASAEGAVENLYSCTECRQSVNHLDGTLKNYFDQIAEEYANYLRTEIKSAGM